MQVRPHPFVLREVLVEIVVIGSGSHKATSSTQRQGVHTCLQVVFPVAFAPEDVRNGLGA